MVEGVEVILLARELGDLLRVTKDVRMRPLFLCFFPSFILLFETESHSVVKVGLEAVLIFSP